LHAIQFLQNLAELGIAPVGRGRNLRSAFLGAIWDDANRA
jgi:hypothetical protein